MRHQRIEGRLKRPVISSAVVATLVAGAMFMNSCGDRSQTGQAPATDKPGTEAPDQALEITTFPGEGEAIRNLGRPIVVEFSRSVDPAAFSFRLSPDSDGWSESWSPGRRQVVLEHASPFEPERSYELDVTMAPSIQVATRFSTLGPTTLELIARDEAAGLIDLDTAWSYRLRRLFQPGRLPERYRSERPIRCGTTLLRGFDRAADKLRPATLEALKPYLVRPDHPLRAPFETTEATPSKLARLFFGRPRAVFLQVGGEGERPRLESTQEWDHVVCDGAPAKFWAPKAFMSTAREGCRHLKQWNMYGRFKKLMTLEPNDDTFHCEGLDDPLRHRFCLEDAGGDSAIDFYLVPSARLDGDGGWCRAVNPADRKSPQWIEINRGLSGDDLARTIAHELFHAFQAAWDDWEDWWWQDATATWSEELINPIWPTEEDLHDVFDPGFHSQVRLNHTDGVHEYAVYLFPYYLEKIRPGNKEVIAEIWKACEHQQSLDAIDSVLDDGFAETLKDFSVVNLDRDPYEDRYGQPLDLYWFHGDRKLDLDIDEEVEFEVPEALDYLSARYQMWTNNLNPAITPLVRFQFDDFADNENLFLHAIIEFDDRVEEEDWSDRSERVFCINREDGNFSQIALILVSAERPPESADGSGGQGTGSRQGLTIPKIKVSVETEACRPTMGTGEFTITIDNRWNDTTGSSSFTETVSGQIVFDSYDPGNAEYRGMARVRYEEHSEKHYREVHGSFVEWTRDTWADIEGSGEVECFLHYSWGSEDTSYNLSCGSIEVEGRTHEIFRRTNPPEVKENSNEFTRTTDVDEGYISSYYGGLPSRYDLVLKGTYLDDDISQGVTKHRFDSWTFSLNPPESP